MDLDETLDLDETFETKKWKTETIGAWARAGEDEGLKNSDGSEVWFKRTAVEWERKEQIYKKAEEDGKIYLSAFIASYKTREGWLCLAFSAQYRAFSEILKAYTFSYSIKW